MKYGSTRPPARSHSGFSPHSSPGYKAPCREARGFFSYPIAVCEIAMRTLSEIEKIRLQKISALTERGVDAYPARTRRTHTTRQALDAFAAASETEKITVTLAGRIRSIRAMGKSIFAHLEDRQSRMQIYLRRENVGEESFALFQEFCDLGDFIEAEGTIFRTKTGEPTLMVARFAFLAKAVSPLPASKETIEDGQRIVHSAFDNPESRYRQRYTDLAVNPEVREIFRTRARVIRALRKYLDGQDFLEVETPILQPVYGGAAARPFTTHHNQLHQDLFLRISFELYLKRLLVGGFERVYEIGRDFRNEGVSFKHNPEFTQLEFYIAYADYLEIMRLTEDMIRSVVQDVLGTTHVTYQGQTIDFGAPWKRLSMRDAIWETGEIDIDQYATAEALDAIMRSRELAPKPGNSRGKLIESLLAHFVEPNLVQPTFIFDYPRDISPLAKNKPGLATVVERFEGFVAGMELCNAFSELNDPLDQESRFLEMSRTYGEEDEDRHPLDEDYLDALRYGMPPTGGFGMGVDRLTMLLTNQSTIREVLLFPHLRQREDAE
jgi:lysyl-tRNA synthetase, class II